VRADVERQLASDLADVVLLTCTDNSDYTEPSDAHRDDTASNPMAGSPSPTSSSRTGSGSTGTDGDAARRTAYLAAVMRAMMRHDPGIERYLSPLCPECGQLPEPEDGVHILLGAAVVVGCEGYWVVNPNMVGIRNPRWQSQQ
jgi:hypothetical protein